MSFATFCKAEMKWGLLQASGGKRLHHCRALGADNWNYSTGLLLLLFYCGPALPWQRSPLLAEGLPYKKLLFAKMWTDKRACPCHISQDEMQSNNLAPTNQCRDSRPASGVEQEWLLSDLNDHFFNSKMRSQRSYTIWVITFTLPCSLSCFRDDIFQDSRSCVQGNDSVIFILVLFPLRDAPGCSPICPFDSQHAQANTC